MQITPSTALNIRQLYTAAQSTSKTSASFTALYEDVDMAKQSMSTGKASRIDKGEYGSRSICLDIPSIPGGKPATTPTNAYPLPRTLDYSTMDAYDVFVDMQRRYGNWGLEFTTGEKPEFSAEERAALSEQYDVEMDEIYSWRGNTFFDNQGNFYKRLYMEERGIVSESDYIAAVTSDIAGLYNLGGMTINEHYGLAHLVNKYITANSNINGQSMSIGNGTVNEMFMERHREAMDACNGNLIPNLSLKLYKEYAAQWAARGLHNSELGMIYSLFSKYI